jgi:hypothetical protein
LKLIGSLLKQLMQDQSAISLNIRELYRNHVKKDTRPTSTELLRALKSEIGAHSKVFIIVDALDECPEDGGRRANLLTALQSLSKMVNLMVTSRPLATFETDLKGMARLDILADDNDVRMYVEGRIPCEKRLARHVRKDPTLHDTLTETIVNSAKGMWVLTRDASSRPISKPY